MAGLVGTVINDTVDTVGSATALTPLGYGPAVIEFFDFFFSDGGGIPQNNFDAFIQWNVSGGSVDLVGGVGPGIFGAPPEQPLGRYVDLGGSTGNPGLFETRLAYPVVAGQTYNFTFDYRSTEGDFNTATASVGNQSFTVSTGSETFQRFSQSFTATETGVVKIAFQGDEADTDGSGIGIDGVLFGPGNGATSSVPGGTSPSNGTSPAVYGSTDDNILGMDRSDTISAGEGDDTVTAGAGNDQIFGNQGTDLLFGNLGDDLIYGGQDSDTAYGGQGDDIVYGNLGDDIVYGNLGDDQIFGNEGADFLHGGQGNDTVYGGQGNDVLNGGLGNDVLQGGLGSDLFVFTPSSGSDVVTDFDFAAGDRLDLGSRNYTAEAGLDGSTEIDFMDGSTIILQGVTADEFNAGFVT